MSTSEYCQVMVVENDVDVFCDEQANPCEHTAAAIRAQAIREYRATLIQHLRAEAKVLNSGGNAYGSGDNPCDYRREGRAEAYEDIADELEAAKS